MSSDFREGAYMEIELENFFSSILPVHGSRISENLKCVFWWRGEIKEKFCKCFKPEFSDYKYIHFMPYKIPEIDNSINIGTKSELPHLDPKSGNVHICWNEQNVIKWIQNPRIEQLVLVKDQGQYPKGPKQNKELVVKEKQKYVEIDDKYGTPYIWIPEACFYPPSEAEREGDDCNGDIKTMLQSLVDQVTDEGHKIEIT